MSTAAPSSLCSGYKQVEAFGPDDEYEDEEVFYVTLDMGNIEPTLVPSSSSYRLIGLDSATPFLQLQGTILKGRHDMLLGTELIFTDDKESHDWNKRSVGYVASTEQRIAFQEVTLVPKLSSRKGKEKVTDGDRITATDFEDVAPTEDRVVQIERLTGLSAPNARASRTRKSAATPKPSAAPRPKRRASTRASTKARSEEQDPHNTDDDDDMYVDN
ncbi:hypothetical protein BDN70DRAFT_882619 [Pholiota conissans]|uniref:Transcription factor TFIIIC triple barrel domain-containing protein n=1 Tax=Pholiota conissans TaxID=109636 RepID=A0A9P6CRK4_9AGAR|nr:hypothetical protein BDN70DRAFT_882619 [Pholiota conissans]